MAPVNNQPDAAASVGAAMVPFCSEPNTLSARRPDRSSLRRRTFQPCRTDWRNAKHGAVAHGAL